MNAMSKSTCKMLSGDSRNKDRSFQTHILPLCQWSRQINSLKLFLSVQCELERNLSLTRKLKSEPKAMDELRTKFVETAMRYIGVPYARRYHEPSCEG